MKADRSVVPRRPDFNRLYASFCDEKYGAKNGEKMFDALEAVIEEYMEANEGSIIQFQRFKQIEKETQPFIMTIVTPLMKRVHAMV